MKRCEALALQEGDLLDVRAPEFRGGHHYGCKVLIVSSRGSIYIADRYEPSRWVQYHFATLRGQREALDRERAGLAALGDRAV
jgi:hypothetical protein